jgi:hypothetical protein
LLILAKGIKSFRKQLSNYKFTRHKTGILLDHYFHESFTRENLSLVRTMQPKPDNRPRNTPSVANIENAPPNIDVNNLPPVEWDSMLTPTSRPESVQGSSSSSSFSNSQALSLSTSSGTTEQDSSSSSSSSGSVPFKQRFHVSNHNRHAATPLMSRNDDNTMREYFEESSYETESHNASIPSPVSHFYLDDEFETMLNEVLKM